MSIRVTEAERCAQVAKALRELADRVEAQAFVPVEFLVENETESKEDWQTGTMRTRPTGYRRLSIRLFVKPPLSAAQEEMARALNLRNNPDGYAD